MPQLFSRSLAAAASYAAASAAGKRKYVIMTMRTTGGMEQYWSQYKSGGLLGAARDMRHQPLVSFLEREQKAKHMQRAVACSLVSRAERDNQNIMQQIKTQQMTRAASMLCKRQQDEADQMTTYQLLVPYHEHSESLLARGSPSRPAPAAWAD